MANVVTNRCKFNIATGTNLVSQTGLKAMLCDDVTAYTPNADDNFVDEAGANDPIDAEYAGTGYTGGFGGAGRHALSGKGWTEDDANDRAEFDATDETWSSIGSGSESINQLVIIDETGAANDAATEVYISIDSGLPVTTNGGDVTFQWNAEGILQLS